MPASKNRWKVLFKLLGPLLFIYFFFKLVDPWAAADLLKQARIEILLLSLLFIPIIIMVITFRWWIICRNLAMDVSFGALLRIFYISWFYANIPISGTSFISKIIYLKEDGTPASTTFLSLTLDKLFDIMGLMLFGIFGFIYFPKALLDEKLLWTFYGTIILIMVIILAFGKKIWAVFRKFLKQYTTKKLSKVGISLEESFKQFRSGFNLKFYSIILGLSLATGILNSLVLYMLAVALHLKVTFVLIVACWALIGIANVIPITVNGLGTRDAVLLFTLPLAGISREAAIALGFIAFLWAICSHFSGVFFWLKRPLPTKEIIAIKNKLFRENAIKIEIDSDKFQPGRKRI